MPFDRIEPVYQRYARGRKKSDCKMWTALHPIRQLGPGKTLRIITAAPARIHWSTDGWSHTEDTDMRSTGAGCWFADLPTAQLAPGSSVVFTFQRAAGWEGRNYEVAVTAEGLIRRGTN
jgi:glucoamylase